MNKQDGFIKEHNCERLSKQNFISVEQHNYKGSARWFWIYKAQMHEVKFCPYCGCDLEGEQKEDRDE